MTAPAGSPDPPGLDLTRLRGFLDQEAPGLAHGPLSGGLIEGGRSNLTYEVTDGESSWVVRRPPLGHVLATAHDMGREFRVIHALAPTPVPVPKTYAYCPDPDLIGAPFYVMEKVPGLVYRTAEQSDRLGPRRAAGLAGDLVDVLADLHDLEPDAVGLADFGRPAGFLDRQLRRWRTQLDASRSRPLPGIEELHARLTAAVPQSAAAAIVHGDFRLDNLMVGPGDRIAAVLDWEMSTLGDPLTDLGLLVVYWDTPHTAVANAVHAGAGFPPSAVLTARYAARRDTDLTRLPWYVGFGYFKLAVIVEGIHYRYVAGQTVGAGFEKIGDMVGLLVELGHEALGAR
ncbi:MAG: phosphotransferase family protein [Sporichthyaceae bacterium]|nr:phosphotransferase family protein [Sporichthyaceae bacterium]